MKTDIHLISDSTGETVHSMFRACISQFPSFKDTTAHVHAGILAERDVEACFVQIRLKPGIVLATVADVTLRDQIAKRCDALALPRLFLLDPLFAFFENHLGELAQSVPGTQHELNDAYFHRIGAMHYALDHDDGQMMNDLSKADLLLIGVSRTSKTPTSLYLANRGLYVANFPLVMELPVPQAVHDAMQRKKPFPIGLIAQPHRLQEIRRQRIDSLGDASETDYTNVERISEEIQYARQLFRRNRIGIIDVSQQSIEETASQIFALYHKFAERDVTSRA